MRFRSLGYLCIGLLCTWACGDDGGSDEQEQEWLEVSVGGDHACAIAADRTLWCWGASETGQLGNGDTASVSTPLQVSALTDVIAVTTGWKHSCAITMGGQAWCWGNNDLYQLGNGDTEAEPSAVPVMVQGVSDAIAIAAGDAHTCAIRSGGSVWCWGLNAEGQLGTAEGDFFDAITPEQVPNVSSANSICASMVHTCVTTSSGVYCWGENLSNQLGPNGGDNDMLDAAVEVPGANITGASMIACGDGHTCAVAGGRAVCWGENGSGQLGDDSTTETATPTTVDGLAGVVAIAASIDHTCAVTDSEVHCWGSNGFTDFTMGGDLTINGKIGQPATVENAQTPQLVDVANPLTISTGDNASCATTTGQTFCWGEGDDGELGNGATDASFTPVAVQLPVAPE